MNLFELPAELRSGQLASGELVERIAGDHDVLVERIVSTGQFTALGEWLAEELDGEP